MKKATVIGLSVAFVALCMYSRAHAEPPPPMWSGALPVSAVVCDTKEQAVSIIEAGRDNAEGMLKKYNELLNTLDARKEPTCADTPPFFMVINEREDKGISHAANGTLMHTWVVHGGNPLGDFWFIYAQAVSDAPDTSI